MTSESGSPNGRLDELYERYADGSLTPAEQRELMGALSDPETARDFVTLAYLEAAMHENLQLRDEEKRLEEHPVSGLRPAVAAAARRATVRAPRRAPSRGKASRRPWIALALAASVAIAALIHFAPWKRAGSTATTSDANAVATLGDVRSVLVERDGRSEAAAEGTALLVGDRMVVGETGQATLLFQDSTRISIDRQSALTLGNGAAGKRIDLSFGGLRAHVAPQPPDAPLVIATPATETRVIGTVFSLETADYGTRLAVESGKVELRRAQDQTTVQVTGGQFVVEQRATPMKVHPLPEASRILESFEAVETGRWITFAGWPKESRIAQRRTAGTVGDGALELTYTPIRGDGAGSYTVLRPAQDWTAFSGTRFWVRGQGSGATLSFEIFDNLGPPQRDVADSWERFVFEFLDDRAGWRQIEAPFRLFKRRAFQRPGAPDDGLTLRSVHGFGFIAAGANGILAVDHIELYRK